MNRNLFIVRHAQPHHSQQYNHDKERELKPEGHHQTSQLGKFLNESNYNIDLMIASDAVRASTTATLIAEKINFPISQIALNEKIYTGDLNDLLTILKDVPDSIHNLMLVGHNPTISELYNYLCGVQHLSMSTCELNLITLTVKWKELIENCGHGYLNYQPAY